MDLRIVATGHVYYRVDNTLAHLLLELLPAAVERVNEGTNVHIPPVTAPPKWFIGMDGGNYPFIGYTFAGQTSRYSGPPEDASKGFQTRVWSGEKQDYVFDGPEPPASIVEQYKQSYGSQPRTTFLPASYYRTASGSGEK